MNIIYFSLLLNTMTLLFNIINAWFLSTHISYVPVFKEEFRTTN